MVQLKNIFSGFCLALFCLPSAYAYHPLSPEDAAVLESGHFEFEMSHDVLENADRNHSVQASYVPKVGLLGRGEIDFSVPVTYSHIHRKEAEEGSEGKKVSEGGFSDLELLIKGLAWSETCWLPAAAIVGKIRFPSGNEKKGLGDPGMGYQVLGAVSKSFKRIVLHGNVGWDFAREAEDLLLLRAAADYELYKNWHAVVEWDAEKSFHSHGGLAASGVLGGVVWNTNDRITLDVGVRAGLVEEDDPFRLTTGLTLHF